MNRLQRIKRLSSDEATKSINRRVTGLARTLNNNLDEATLKTLQEEIRLLNINYERLQPIVYPSTYRKTLQTIVNLAESVKNRIQEPKSPQSSISNDDPQRSRIQEPKSPQSSISNDDPQRSTKRLVIDKEKLESFLSFGFSVRQISKRGLLGKTVHYNTIHNFMKNNSMLSMSERFTLLSDERLKDMIKTINSNFPNSGIREIIAHLKSRDPPVKLQRNRCARLLAEIDQIGTAVRWAQTIKRRQYSVPTPNSLWHIDSNHGLVKWGFVVFGQIDGFSRLITQLHLATNNTASTALLAFIKSIKEFGIPSRIRLDGGTEFNHVEFMMNQLNGSGRGSVIRGPSVHNQRIERLWRDVFCKVLAMYYKTFVHMEEHRVLDIQNQVHMYSLHYVYGPRIQQSLRVWTAAHNIHPIRTEKNQTPKMLWYGGSLKSQSKDCTAMNNLFRRDTEDADQVTSNVLAKYRLVEPEDISVVLPRYVAPLTNVQMEGLVREIDPLGGSSSGVDVYGLVVQYISRCMAE